MSEVWLHSNRRVLLLGMIPVGLLLVVGWALRASQDDTSLGWIGIGCIVVAALLLVGLVWQMLRPRVAYRQGEVLFYLRAGRPIAVPLSVVEAFFQGQSDSHLPAESVHHTKSVNLIARLSRREANWHERTVKPALGRWEDGYVTVRGTWCEPITEEVIRQLNRRLGEVTRAEQALAEGNQQK